MHVPRQFPTITAPYCIALEKSVGAVIFRQVANKQNSDTGADAQPQWEFLLMQYPHGHWEFPRGHVEQGEDEHTAMYREIEEETSIVKSQLSLIEGFRDGFSFSYRARGDEKKDRIKKMKCLFIRKNVYFYLVQAHNAQVTLSHEHKKFAWLPLEEAIDTLTFTNAKKTLIKAHDVLRKQSESKR